MTTLFLPLLLGSFLAAAPRPEPPLRYLALGDSYTIGEGVEPDERWPVRLVGLLRGQGLAVEDPQIVARTGWTVGELDSGIDAAAPRGPYGLVTLLIGVNDQYRGKDAEGYRRDLRAMLQRAVGFAGGKADRVILVSIPDWGVTPFAAQNGRSRDKVGAEIDLFNRIGREEAHKAGARTVDVTPFSRKAAADPSLLAADGLHPSGAMYAEWARLVLPEAREVLQASR